MKTTVRADGFEGYKKRALARAKKLDREEPMEESMTLTFADPLALLSVLTEQRIRLFDVVRHKPDISISGLAVELKRDVKAVRRDVSKLEECGIVRTSIRPNPGHGKIRVVQPVAHSISLHAVL